MSQELRQELSVINQGLEKMQGFNKRLVKKIGKRKNVDAKHALHLASKIVELQIGRLQRFEAWRMTEPCIEERCVIQTAQIIEANLFACMDTLERAAVISELKQFNLPYIIKELHETLIRQKDNGEGVRLLTRYSLN